MSVSHCGHPGITNKYNINTIKYNINRNLLHSDTLNEMNVKLFRHFCQQGCASIFVDTLINSLNAKMMKGQHDSS